MRTAIAIACLWFSAAAFAAPLGTPAVPVPEYAKGYPPRAYAADQRKAKRYAADFTREHNLKPDAQERIAKARLVELRTNKYPRNWSQQQKMRLYRKELIAVQRAKAKADAHDPVTNAPHPFTDKFVEWEKEQKKIARQEKREAGK